MDNLKYDWLMMMSLGGAVVSFYHVTSKYKKVKPSVRFGRDLVKNLIKFGMLGL